jgi:hypothetical protein
VFPSTIAIIPQIGKVRSYPPICGVFSQDTNTKQAHIHLTSHIRDTAPPRIVRADTRHFYNSNVIKYVEYPNPCTRIRALPWRTNLCFTRFKTFYLNINSSIVVLSIRLTHAYSTQIHIYVRTYDTYHAICMVSNQIYAQCESTSTLASLTFPILYTRPFSYKLF